MFGWRFFFPSLRRALHVAGPVFPALWPLSRIERFLARASSPSQVYTQTVPFDHQAAKRSVCVCFFKHRHTSHEQQHLPPTHTHPTGIRFLAPRHCTPVPRRCLTALSHSISIACCGPTLFFHASPVLTIPAKKTKTIWRQDHSDSDGEGAGEAGLAGRRFFNRKRRSTETSLASADRVQPNTEGQGRLRRMSLAMSRRPRASSLQTPAAGTSAEGGGGPTPAPLGSQGASRKLNDGDEIEVATRGVAASAAGGGGGGGRVDNEEETAKEKELPPFTMALAVMLTGLRVFVVDQVRCGPRLINLKALGDMVLICAGGTLWVPSDRNRCVDQNCSRAFPTVCRYSGCTFP